jgi:CAAX protease family protein
MTGATEGRAGIRRLLRRFVLWRVGLRWYLFALVGVPVVMALGTLIVPRGMASLLALSPRYVPTYLVWFLIIGIIGGPLLEEPGWRGFALPRLQPRHGPLVGASSWGYCGHFGTCPSSWFRLGPSHRVAVAFSISSGLSS